MRGPLNTVQFTLGTTSLFINGDLCVAEEPKNVSATNGCFGRCIGRRLPTGVCGFTGGRRGFRRNQACPQAQPQCPCTQRGTAPTTAFVAPQAAGAKSGATAGFDFATIQMSLTRNIPDLGVFI